MKFALDLAYCDAEDSSYPLRAEGCAVAELDCGAGANVIKRPRRNPYKVNEISAKGVKRRKRRPGKGRLHQWETKRHRLP